VSLVLYVIGLFGMLIVNTQRVTDYLQENVLVILYFDNQIEELELTAKTDSLESLKFVKSARYITGNDAAFDYKEVLGKDFVEVLGSNPLPASIEINLSASAVEGRLSEAIEGFKAIDGVQGVDFQQDLVRQIESNKRIAGLILMAIAMILLLVALILINNTIRLEVYSQRFIIKSMQLVGASEWFVVRPFIGKSVVITLISSVTASVLVYLSNKGLTSWVEHNFFEVQHIFTSDITIYSILFATIIVLGLCIVLPSTYFATKKYLRQKIDDLY
jgi:cell division transport system permease protein